MVKWFNTSFLEKTKGEWGSEVNSQKCPRPMDENRGLRGYTCTGRNTSSWDHSIKPVKTKTHDPLLKGPYPRWRQN